MSETDALSIARALVRCPSITPHEAGALELLQGLLERAGFTVERTVFSEPGTPDVDNLYARIGGDGPCLVFAGHTDVVPPGPEERWTHPPFAAEIVGDRLYGRGAEDMKGGVAAAVAAAIAHVREYGAPKHQAIAFLITGDEEGPAVNGTVKMLEFIAAKGHRMDCCVLGEPTNVEAVGDTIKIGRRGSLTGRLTVTGKQGHVAYPERARNPIPDLLRLMQATLAQPLDPGTAHFAASNLEFTSVDVGNPASNVIPQQATAVFNIRFNDLWTLESLGAEIRRRVAAAARDGTAFTLAFEPSNATAFLTAPGPFVEQLSRSIGKVTNRTPTLSTTGGTSDARFIKDHCPVLEFGLVGRTMHQIDENIGLADLDALTRVYAALLSEFCAG